MIRLAAVAATALLVSGGYGSDVTLLQRELPLIHPHVRVKAFDAAAARLRARLPGMTESQADVGFMKLVASLGNRNGHTGIFPLDPGNARAFHEYPFLVYEFADGVYVIDEKGSRRFVGARLMAVGGVPIARVLARVKPLVPRDNPTTGVKTFRSMYVLSEEVLDGLGIKPRFALALPTGKRVVWAPAPISAGAYSHRFHGLGPPMWPNGAAYDADRRALSRVSLLASGHVVYVAYNTTSVDTTSLADNITQLASDAAVTRIVIDLRNNRGGDNHTYPPLIAALQTLAGQNKEIVVLAGRATFSAAANFMGDLEAATTYLLVGENSGGAPNLYGDAQPLDLPKTGLRVEVATTWWVKSKLGAGDPRVTFHPDVVVRPTAQSWFAGEDPALDAALTEPFSKAHAVH
jgi:hypothetical protein